MKRSEAYHILGKMWESATAEQAEALSIAQEDIEFVDLMPEDMVAVVRCKDCAWCKKPFPEHFPQMLECMRFDMEVAADEFCSRSERRDNA